MVDSTVPVLKCRQAPWREPGHRRGLNIRNGGGSFYGRRSAVLLVTGSANLDDERALVANGEMRKSTLRRVKGSGFRSTLVDDLLFLAVAMCSASAERRTVANSFHHSLAASLRQLCDDHQNSLVGMLGFIGRSGARTIFFWSHRAFAADCKIWQNDESRSKRDLGQWRSGTSNKRA
jgi:hypothetical protein